MKAALLAQEEGSNTALPNTCDAHPGPGVSLAGAATSTIFVMTKRYVVINTCRNKHNFVVTKLCHDKHVFVTTKHLFCFNKSMLVMTKAKIFCCDKSFVVTNIILLRQTHVWRDKSMLVMTKLLSQQNYVCCDKYLSQHNVCMTNMCLSRQKTSIFLSRQKTCFVTTNTSLSQQK